MGRDCKKDDHKQKSEKLTTISCSKYEVVINEEEQRAEVLNKKTGKTVNLVDLPGDFVDEWNSGTSGLDSLSYAENSKELNVKNIKDLELKYKTFIPTLPEETLQCNDNVTVTLDSIYLTSQNSDLFAPLLGNPTGNYVVAINRSNGKIRWKKLFADLTGNPSSASRGAPTIWGDYMFVSSSNVFSAIQSTADPEDPTKDLGFKLFGFFPITGSGFRPAIVCLNRHTGDIVWIERYGKVASNFNDVDNFRTFGFGMRVVSDVDITGNGDKRTLLLVGSNQGGQYFMPYFFNQDRPGGTQIGPALQRDRTDFGGPLRPYTSQGSVMIIDALTGGLMKELPLGAANLKEKDVIVKGGPDPMFDPFIPGKNSVRVRLPVDEVPLKSTLTANYNIENGNWTSLNLNADAAFLGVPEIKDTVPAFADGVKGLTNQGVEVTLTAGETVAANPNYDGMNVRINIVWVLGSPGEWFTVPEGSAPLQQFYVDVLVGMRVTKQLLNNHELSENEAYELRYAGPSCWASPFPVNFDKCDRPVEFYVTTGQGHKVPYDESLYFDSSSNYSNNKVPVNSNFIARQQLIANVSNALNPSLLAIRAQEKISLDVVKQRTFLSETAISPRGKLNRTNAVVAVNLRPGNFGEELWSFATSGFDQWTSGQSTGGRNSGYSRELVEGSEFNGAGFVQSKNFYETPMGVDGDFGERCYLIKGEKKRCKKKREADKIFWANKQGHGGVLELSSVNKGPSTYEVKVWRIQGTPATDGGSNYGSCSDKKNLYTLQQNIADNAKHPVNGSENFYDTYPYYPQMNDKYPNKPLVAWNPAQSYVSSMDLEGKINWETLISPDAPENPSKAGLSCTDELLFVGSSRGSNPAVNEGRLRVFETRKGKQVKEFVQEFGNSSVAIADNEVYVWMGRPAAGGQAVQYFRTYSLQKKDDSCDTSSDSSDSSDECHRKHKKYHHKRRH
jgi:hypothetical protein